MVFALRFIKILGQWEIGKARHAQKSKKADRPAQYLLAVPAHRAAKKGTTDQRESSW
jgi:hypothetical protein